MTHPTPPLSPSRDWVGHWLSLIERAGEDMSIRFGRLDDVPDDTRGGDGDSPEVAWRYLSHAQYDGLGALATLLDEAVTPPHAGLPAARSVSPANRAERLRAFARIVARKSSTATLRGHDLAWRARGGVGLRCLPEDHAVAWRCFSRAETAAIVAGARTEGVTVNSALLWALARATAAEMDGDAGVWLVPVNLRGLVQQRVPHANHIGFLHVRVGRDASARGVHDAVRGEIARGAHWGAWTLANLGEALGERAIEGIARARRPGRRGTLGVFSNLGALDGDGRDAWLFCPPTSLSQPLAVGALTWNGRLALLLQFHPSLSRSAADARALLDRWTAALGRAP